MRLFGSPTVHRRRGRRAQRHVRHRALLLLLAQWLQLVEHHSPLEAGVHLLPLAAGGLVASLLAAPLARIIGARLVLSGGLAVAGIGMVLIWVVPGDLTYPIAAVAMAMAGAGAGSLAIGSAMVMAGTPPAKAGNAAAIEETAYDLGTVLGVAVLGSLASLVYRQQLDVDQLVDDGPPPPSASPRRTRSARPPPSPTRPDCPRSRTRPVPRSWMRWPRPAWSAGW